MNYARAVVVRSIKSVMGFSTLSEPELVEGESNGCGSGKKYKKCHGA
jgi:uncharacterized protein YchJ